MTRDIFEKTADGQQLSKIIPTDVVVEKLLGKAKLSLFLFGRRKLVYHTQH